MSTEQIGEKVKMPISLKFAVGLLLFRIFIVLLIVTLQVWFLSSPPTGDIARGVWAGMQKSLGEQATNPSYVMGYSFASLSLAMPILPAAFGRSKRWLTAARVCIILEMLSNFGQVNIPGAFGNIIVTCLLFSKGAKKFVAKEPVPAQP